MKSEVVYNIITFKSKIGSMIFFIILFVFKQGISLQTLINGIIKITANIADAATI